MKILFSWLFTYTIFLSFFTLDQVSCRCSLSDHSSLLKLNRSINLHDPSWNASSDCCVWEGVSCDQDGHVTHLEVSSNRQIIGTLNNSNSVFHLQHLKTLHVAPLCTITILNLTMFLQNFPQLEELTLDGADLSATGKGWCRALSSSVPKLKVLSLTWCRLSGPLDHSLLRLQSLSVINLAYNKLNCPLPKFFANFSNLISLDFSESGLQGTVPREIFQIPTLQSISLTDNEFLQGTLPEFPINNSLQFIDLSHTKFSSRLPGSVGNLWNLSGLSLSNCQFDGPLSRSIENLTQLKYVSLSDNKFTGLIPSSLFALPALEIVNLSNNQFISFEVASPSNLSSIDLSENSLNGEISSHHFEGLTKLNYLSLSSNSLNSIPSSLFALPSLKNLDLSNNQFKYCETANSSTLNFLDLSRNNLEDLGSVLASMIKLENLTSVDLSYNKFNSIIQLNIFQGFNRLEYLDLSHNKFNDIIQLNIFQGFNRLEYLDLSYNKLSVDVSYNSLESLPHVSQLHLASCNVTEFPHFKNRSNLFDLDLSNNQISGEIPNWIWGGSFTSLNLSHNNLSAIQEPYSFPYSLFSIDLNSNRLQGEISFSHFPHYADFSSNNFSSVHIDNISENYREFLDFLSFSNNNITGDIPKSICQSVYFRSSILDLSHNKLSGRIPTCIAEENESLEVLNLRENNLIGPIPDAFPRDCSLQIIDLNVNFIDGEIPKSLANCAQLRVLDLGHNNMIGEFPCFLKNISTLQVLILRANNLHGSIKCLDSDGAWPMLQILDIAQNKFSGELRVKWLENLQVMKNDTLAGLKSNVLEIAHTHPVSFSKTGDVTLERYYEYVVTTVTLKGQERELSKILTIYTWIDLSCNNFSGSIPKELGQLRALNTLNLSNNALTGEIPSSLGNLRELETLDLSHNNLNGMIPASLGGLNFLDFMNLSFNQLTGKIPEGGQIQTFSEDSFIGNKGLCGFPLKKNCSVEEKPTNPREDGIHENSKIDWNLISAEIGFFVGIGAVIAPIVFLRRWRILYFDGVDDIIVMIFPLAVARKWFQWTNTY